MAFSYKDYVESDAVKKKREEAEANSIYKESSAVTSARDNLQNHTNNKVADWSGGTYGEALKEQLNKINNRPKFSYDLNADALYQQYKDQYINQGRLAMQDAMGQASALTGGYGNSYAATVGNQAYQSYLTQLNNVVPELYQMAYTKYNQEGQDLKDVYNILQNQYNTEYGEYRDKVADWNTEAARLTDAYNNERNFDYAQFSSNRDYYANQYNNERNYDYGMYSDAYNRAFANYQQSVAEDQWAKNYALQQQQLALSASRSSGGGSGRGSKNSESSLKTPTNEMMAGAAEAYNTGGEKALDAFVNSYPGYDADVIYEYIANYGVLPMEQRTYTKTKDTINWGWGIDNDDIVEDQYGKKYRIDELPKSVQKDLTKLKKGESWTPSK